MKKVETIGSRSCKLSIIRSLQKAQINGEQVSEIVCFEKQNNQIV